ncbi:MAG: DUF3750 domain-containing protein [Gammaproteobacteria bacterium]
MALGFSGWSLAGAGFLLLFVMPVATAIGWYAVNRTPGLEYWQARNDSTGQAPDPAAIREAVVQVYAARAFGWRGALGVHTWIAVKPSAARHYTRYEVIGWGVARGNPALRIRGGLAADGYWFNSRPVKLVDLRGAGVDAIIAKIDGAARRYPHNDRYVLWPGPNSNTFTAYIGRAVPELKLELPPTAIGKDYIAAGGWFARSPSGTGYQLAWRGLIGVMLGWKEGVEVNVLGLTVGFDVLRPALKLPGLGRLGLGPV